LTINLAAEAAMRTTADVVTLNTALATETTRAMNAEGTLIKYGNNQQDHCRFVGYVFKTKSVSVTTDGASDDKYSSVKSVNRMLMQAARQVQQYWPQKLPYRATNAEALLPAIAETNKQSDHGRKE
jgi:hypothetical protein